MTARSRATISNELDCISKYFREVRANEAGQDNLDERLNRLKSTVVILRHPEDLPRFFQSIRDCNLELLPAELACVASDPIMVQVEASQFFMRPA